MQPSRHIIFTIFLLILCQVSIETFGQMGISFDIKKPEEYDDRVLRSEKSEEKKLTLPRRFIQNTFTHYNYHFNANNKLNEIIERAKLSFKDDYAELLPFYNYTLDATAADSIQLDSVIYKSSTGVILHDLRNDWVDNLYLLWGAAYYLRKDFDSAYLMFQFINYAFAPKEKDGYYLTIGSNRDGNSASSISTKEKNSLPRRLFSEPPSRNEAFIWQIRNFLAQDQFPEAASLIVTLKNDPVFPKRLQNDLHEVQAYWFYKQNMWDSAASHLVQALSNATNQQEKARWEYLIAQLYEKSGHYKEAEKYFGKVSAHTTDPILDIYARLAAIRANKDEGEKSIEKNVATLMKMAKQDKFEDYRDIVYYMAAQMLLEGKEIDRAIALLLKSILYPASNTEQRNKTFLQLAELSFEKKQYRNAYNFYDSLKMDDPTLKNLDAIVARKNMLGKLATNIEIIERQDSLQRIAKMPEDERRDFIKKMVKQLRKQQGLKDETPLSTGNPFVDNNPTILFPSGGTARGEWYFYNATSRSRGQNDFKSKWGTRPNVDNWRRSATVVAGAQNTGNNQGQNNDRQNNNADAGNELTYDGLLSNLPISEQQLKKSNDSIQEALFTLGIAYIQEVEDCSAGTTTLELLRSRFSSFEKMDEVLFNLYYCYNKNGNAVEAATMKKLLFEQHKNSNYTTIVLTGKNPLSTSSNSEATKTYEGIYDLFIEGNFEKAIADKKEADKKFGRNFWTPQLLYIEAVYYIKQRDDSTATTILQSIMTQFPNTPLETKARGLIDVLSRRAQIESELKNLVVTRNQDGVTIPKPVTTIPGGEKKPTADTTTKKPTAPVVSVPPPLKDTTTVKPITPAPATVYKYVATESYYVVLVLNKVDPVFSTEAKNAFFRYNRETFYNKTYSVDLTQLDADNRLLLIAPFKDAKDAVEYVDKTQPKTAAEIIPWLKGGKYSFTIISTSNLELLKADKNVEKYKAFLNQHWPGKF